VMWVGLTKFMGGEYVMLVVHEIMDEADELGFPMATVGEMNEPTVEAVIENALVVTIVQTRPPCDSGTREVHEFRMDGDLEGRVCGVLQGRRVVVGVVGTVWGFIRRFVATRERKGTFIVVTGRGSWSVGIHRGDAVQEWEGFWRGIEAVREGEIRGGERDSFIISGWCEDLRHCTGTYCDCSDGGGMSDSVDGLGVFIVKFCN
jgi:hypothetical protein